MPTFTAIALDSLIEPGAAKSMVQMRNSPDPRLERRRSTSNSIEGRGVDNPNLNLERVKLGRGVDIPSNTKLEKGENLPPNGRLARGVSVPPKMNMERGVGVPPNGKLGKGVSVPAHMKLDNGAPTATSTVADNNKHHWTQISPALYATPVSTPLPDSPSSFPPSPYIINHKRRGPRLNKSFSEDDVATWKKETNEIKVDENGNAAEKEVPSGVSDSTIDDNIKPGFGDAMEKHMIGACNDEHGSGDMENGLTGQNGVTISDDFSFPQIKEVDDFVDQQDSVSGKSIGENEGNGGAEQSFNSTTPMAEFYDAWEELSSEGGTPQPLPDIESELREIRLTLLMEIEKRKQAEETLKNLRKQWQRIREQLSLVGLSLPADPATLGEGEQPADPAAELCQQVYLARFVSNTIGRGVAKAEVEMEMEAQISLKNIEIARLLDKLRYFEAVNQEMSQRNQEVVEMARRHRQRRNRRHKWMWGSIATAATVGSAVFLYSYLRGGKGSSSHSESQSPLR
ncbi:hypothetical protein ACS0TY_029956 [Phlomoides rotata]